MALKQAELFSGISVEQSPAAVRVMRAMQDCVGADVPSPILQVISAKTVQDLTIAKVMVWDGAISEIHVSKHRLGGWVIEWKTASPLALAWDAPTRQWMRCSLERSSDR